MSFLFVTFCALGFLPTSAEAKPMLFPVQERARYGYIDAKGKLVVPLKYVYAYRFSEGLGRVTVSKDRFGLETQCFIDAGGKLVIGPDPPKGYEHLKGDYEWRYHDFHEGLAVFSINQRDGRCGYIDKTGKLVIEAKFQSADDFREGLACVSMPRLDGLADGPKLTGFIDKAGRIAIEPKRAFSAAGFVEGVCRISVQDSDTYDWRLGYIDRSGNVIVPEEYCAANDFGEGLARVRLSIDTPFGYIDKTGALAIPMEFDHAKDFVNGIAFAAKGKQAMLIDKTGRTRVELPFDATKIDIDTFSEGLAVVSELDGERRSGYIDEQGKIAIPMEFDTAQPFQDGLAMVTKGEFTGYIDRRGEFVWKTTKWVDPF